MLHCEQKTLPAGELPAGNGEKSEGGCCRRRHSREVSEMSSVKLSEVIEKEKLINLTPEIDVTKIKIKQPDINRPAVQLTGYFEHFDAARIQVLALWNTPIWRI